MQPGRKSQLFLLSCKSQAIRAASKATDNVIVHMPISCVLWQSWWEAAGLMHNMINRKLMIEGNNNDDDNNNIAGCHKICPNPTYLRTYLHGKTLQIIFTIGIVSYLGGGSLGGFDLQMHCVHTCTSQSLLQKEGQRDCFAIVATDHERRQFLRGVGCPRASSDQAPPAIACRLPCDKRASPCHLPAYVRRFPSSFVVLGNSWFWTSSFCCDAASCRGRRRCNASIH